MTPLMQVSNIGFIMMHGHNEGNIVPYTDIEFQQRKYTLS